MDNKIIEKAEVIIEELCRDPDLSKYIDPRFHTPKPYIGSGPIRLFILGQDPTVKKAASRQYIRTVLNLDKQGSMHVYLKGLCLKLCIDIDQNVYATNIFKNFFVSPPTQIREQVPDVFDKFLPIWLPMLKEELALFPDVPVITLGQPVLQLIVNSGVPNLMKHYWGYTIHWKQGELESFHYLQPEDNILGRTIFPFPHMPAINCKFYAYKKSDFIAFMKSESCLENPNIANHLQEYK